MSGITVGAGDFLATIYAATAAEGLTVVAGQARDISIGGYLTAGGHSALSPIHGLGADNVLEFTVVTPAGDIVTANECQHTDLFWALRGGAGASFGVIITATLRTFPTPKMGTYTPELIIPTSSSDAFWNISTFFFKQMPSFVEQGISGYFYVVPAGAGYGALVITGIFIGPGKTAKAVEAAVAPLLNYATTALSPGYLFSANVTDYATFADYYAVTHDTSPVGFDVQLGSRLLNAQVLEDTSFEALSASLIDFAGNTGLQAIMVGGPGVWNAKPRGGSNAVNSAWRNHTVVHTITLATWSSLNTTGKTLGLSSLETQMSALRKLAPYSGAYINEGDADEPNYQQAFWGTNYARLKAIKNQMDPTNVLWCHPCVGDEAWKERDDGTVCQV